MFKVNCHRLASVVLVLLVLSSVALIQAQVNDQRNTLALGDKPSPAASIADVAWIAGHWQGSAFGGMCDEIWSPPAGNSMVGMFRLVKNGKTVFYELMTIVEENQTLSMKLKHFGADLNGWEEKNVSQNFPLVQLKPNEAFFNGLTYRKLHDGTLQIFAALKNKSGERTEEEFRMRAVMTAEPKPEEQLSIRTYALKINVDDMQKALMYYGQKLGFEVEDQSGSPQMVTLKTGDRVKLILNLVKSLQSIGPKDSQVGLTLQVNDLEQSIQRLKSLDVKFAESEPRKEAVGNAITILDPFGRRISLMHQTITKVEPFKEPRIYNFGLLVPDMNKARNFYSDILGFVVRSEKYLPLDLPLGHADKSFGFMLHYRSGVQPIKSEYPRAVPYYTIVFESESLQNAIDELRRNNIQMMPTEAGKDGKPRSVIFKDPFGNISELTTVRAGDLN